MLLNMPVIQHENKIKKKQPFLKITVLVNSRKTFSDFSHENNCILSFIYSLYVVACIWR